MEPRTYRHWVETTGLVPFTVAEKETDLYILAGSDLRRKAHRIILKYRAMLEGYIRRQPEFLTSLEPLVADADALQIVRDMAAAGLSAGVGPMAAVAGAMAESVGRELLGFSKEIIVENGGDIFMASTTDRSVAIYAGGSPLSGRLAIKIKHGDTPLGICTSSGTVGHSLSLGRADAVVVVSKSAALADAAATATANRVREAADIDPALEFAKSIEEILGAVVIIGEHVGGWGAIELTSIEPK